MELPTRWGSIQDIDSKIHVYLPLVVMLFSTHHHCWFLFFFSFSFSFFLSCFIYTTQISFFTTPPFLICTCWSHCHSYGFLVTDEGLQAKRFCIISRFMLQKVNWSKCHWSNIEVDVQLSCKFQFPIVSVHSFTTATMKFFMLTQCAEVGEQQNICLGGTWTQDLPYQTSAFHIMPLWTCRHGNYDSYT